MTKKILVVDDDEGIVDALSMILEDNGYQIETGRTEQEIYSKINSFKPDLMLLDVLLSGYDGREICQKLKGSPITHNIPIIMTSAHPHIEKTIQQYGADAFIAKPFDTDKLLEIVSNQVSQ